MKEYKNIMIQVKGINYIKCDAVLEIIKDNKNWSLKEMYIKLKRAFRKYEGDILSSLFYNLNH